MDKRKYYGVRCKDLRDGTIRFYGKGAEPLSVSDDIENSRKEIEDGTEYRFLNLDEEKIRKFGIENPDEFDLADFFAKLPSIRDDIVNEQMIADVVEIDSSMADKVNYLAFCKKAAFLRNMISSAKRRNAEVIVVG